MCVSQAANSFSATYKQNSCDTLYRNLINCNSLNLTLSSHYDHRQYMHHYVLLLYVLFLDFVTRQIIFRCQGLTFASFHDDQVKTVISSFLGLRISRVKQLLLPQLLNFKKRKQIAYRLTWILSLVSTLKSITINHIETNSFDLPSTSWTLLHLKMSCLSGPELAHLVELLSDKSLESVTLEVLCSR